MSKLSNTISSLNISLWFPRTLPTNLCMFANQFPKVPELAAFLQGSWRVERTVLDRSRGLSGTFSGSIEFQPAGGGLRYREAGTFSWSGSRAPATRDYFLQQTDDPARLDWYFANSDGSPSYFFHAMNLRSGSWQADHPCAADFYRVDYSALNREQLVVIWDVTGPTKNHLLSSDWQRIA